jgi:transcriptional regulator with XRE-family HTH domain
VNTSISFSEWLLLMLEKKDWSQADLARAAKVSRSAISEIISEQRQIGKRTATSIANALKLPPEQVFRAAGLLPPEKDEDPWVEDMSHKISKLSPGLRSITERFVNGMLDEEEKQSKTKTKPKAKSSTSS